MLAREIIESNQNNIYEFPSNTLSNYLINYDIRKQEFDFSPKNEELKALKQYHDDKLEFASRMVLEGEFVGDTFNNLDKITLVLHRNKSGLK